MNKLPLTIGLLIAVLQVAAPAADLAAQGGRSLADTDLSGLALRNIGPAINGGRIADIEIHPENPNVWYVAVGSGGVWKTVNAGTTWEPIFDDQPSYSIGNVSIAPSEPSTVWVGTGEDVGGRHVGYGDGIYKSADGGSTWTNMGLRQSEHLSTILVHPTDPDVVWVAAQGPLWTPGGERGLYKTTDGGATWRRVLEGENEWTGVTDVVMDPRNPDRLFAATWQRHRTVAAYMGGGPGTGIWRSDDGGETWTELTTGLPSSNMGKIGLAISPIDPDNVYAAIELDRRTGGVWRSEDAGASWRKVSDAVGGGTGPHYYQELYASPHHAGTLYLVSNTSLYSVDHGDTFQRMDDESRHGDDHAFAFRAGDPEYILVGTDGGLFESFDRAKTWKFVANLPLMQYYKISVDDARPFYHVFGGTQDNGSNGGPSRTDYEHGIRNADWFKTLGADGHDSATEPGNPDIVYAETQQGGLHRIDRLTGEQVFIQPQAREGEPFERFNWDAPIEISPHRPTRIYFASQRVWRSDDRGDSWTPISGDLTHGEERLALPIMGRVQSWDNPWDVSAMSNYNTITSLAESPIVEGLIYAGTDDGLLNVTEDGGRTWRRIELRDIRGVPATAFVNDIKAGLFDPNTVYVALDNHKYGDYRPYLIRSTNRGRSWTSIAGDLPDRHLVWRVVQDHVDPELLFAGTEFGLFFTRDGGATWIELEGAPTISFRDVDIQRDHQDVVAGSFGRGIFILDDYTPLRALTPDLLAREAALLPPGRPVYWYRPKDIEDSQGDAQYTAENPPFGAVFTYYLRDGYRSLEAERRARERAIAAGEDVPFPGWDRLEAEARQRGPAVQLVVRDAAGNVINRVDAPATAGVHRVAWDLEHAPQTLIGLGEEDQGRGAYLALPGSYSATLVKMEQGQVTQLAGPVGFEVVPLREGALPRAPADVVAAFRAEVEAFQHDLARTTELLDQQRRKVEALQTALRRAPEDDPALMARLEEARMGLLELGEALRGSEAKDDVGERGPPTPSSRLSVGMRGLSTMYGPTELHRRTVAAGRAELVPLRAAVERMANEVVPSLEQAVAARGGPPIGG